MKKTILALSVAFLAVGMSGLAAAQENVGGAEVTEGETSGPFSGTDAGTVEFTDAGEIIENDVDTTESTLQWAATYGLANGELILADDDDDNRLYDWEASAPTVIASQENVEFTEDFQTATASDIQNVFGFLDGSDSAENTFEDGATEPASESNIFNGPDTTAVDTYDGGDTGVWTTAFYENTAEESVFVAPTLSDQDFWDGTTVGTDDDGYQMILPEDDGNTEEYSLWVELE